jgi:signal transduction histidine kinase
VTSRPGLARGRPLLYDVALVAVFVVLLVDRQFLGLGTPTDIAGNAGWTFPLFLLGDLALLWRRTAPASAAVLFYAAYALHALITDAGVEGAFALFPALTALFSLGAYSTGRRLVAGFGGVVVLSAVHDSHDPGLSLSNDTEVWSYLMWTCVIILFFVGGILFRTARLAASERTAAAVAEERHAEAVTSERAKIARELHDVVTHNVNVVVLQAMAATGILESDPERVREPLRAIESSGREALAEMRRMLGVLRDDDEMKLSPQPGLGDVRRLAETLRGAGQDVGCRFSGDLEQLPDGMGMVVFRIVQEALTNMLKHANGSHATVEVRATPAAVEVEVTNTAGAGEREATGAGHGLVGMAERAALFGGRLEAAATHAGGFRVLAWLPTTPVQS